MVLSTEAERWLSVGCPSSEQVGMLFRLNFALSAAPISDDHAIDLHRLFKSHECARQGPTRSTLSQAPQ